MEQVGDRLSVKLELFIVIFVSLPLYVLIAFKVDNVCSNESSFIVEER